MDLKKALEGKLSTKELSLLKTSFDIVGSIAIVEIPKELEKKEKIIAETLLKLHKNIKTVCKKVGDRKGKYRLRKYKKIKGNGFETFHKESGCRFKLDIRKAYFSVRESTERLRIVEQINAKDNVLVLFSGIGPFGIILAKKTDCKVDMVEINPKACEYAEKNIELNKVGDKVKNYCSDVKKAKLGKYSKIIMPLPETGYRYLDLALDHCEHNSVIYLYAIVGKEQPVFGDRVKILNKRKVLPYAPGVWKMCFELGLK